MIPPRVVRSLADVGVKRWARSHSNGKRYNIMITLNVEYMNVVLKDAKDLPVVRMVEKLTSKMVFK